MSTTFRVLLRSDARSLTKDLNKLKTKINFCLFLVEVQQVNSKPRRRVATVTAVVRSVRHHVNYSTLTDRQALKTSKLSMGFWTLKRILFIQKNTNKTLFAMY